MKKITLLLTSIITLVSLVGCQTVTDPNTGKTTKTLTPAAKAEAQQVGLVAAQAIGNAIGIAVTNSATQYITNGKVDTKQLASAEVYGIASNAQVYVGQLVPKSTLVGAASTPEVKNAVSDVLPDKVLVTQSTVNALYTQAAALTPTSAK